MGQRPHHPLTCHTGLATLQALDTRVTKRLKGLLQPLVARFPRPPEAVRHFGRPEGKGLGCSVVSHLP